MLTQEFIHAHGDWVVQQISNGWDPYYINIMFDPLSPADGWVSRQMEVIIENQFYPTLCRKTGPHPGRRDRHQFLPRVILFADLPVYKLERPLITQSPVNYGLHYNGFVSISPNSRLRESLVAHFKRFQETYAKHGIARIHVVPITETPHHLSDCAMKTIKRRPSELRSMCHLAKSFV